MIVNTTSSPGVSDRYAVSIVTGAAYPLVPSSSTHTTTMNSRPHEDHTGAADRTSLPIISPFGRRQIRFASANRHLGGLDVDVDPMGLAVEYDRGKP